MALARRVSAREASTRIDRRDRKGKMMKLGIGRATRAGSTMEMTTATDPVGLFMALTGTTREVAASITEAIRRAEEDAAIDAEDILTQAEEANALDPVG
jgi:hypothetical protein